jgi:putative NADH-flavin reductase
MESKIKIAVIGGTGKSGKYLVKELIKQGYPLKLLIRDPAKFQIKNSLVELIVGDVTNYRSISLLIDGCQAVISTLGMGIPASEPTIFSQSTSNIIQAMNEQKISRYIVTTGLNVDAQFDNKSPKTLFATDWMRKNYPISTANKQLEQDILSNCNLDWTLVRLPLIEQTDKIGETIVSLEDCPGDKVSSTDLANFLIEQLSNETFIRKSPFIASV